MKITLRYLLVGVVALLCSRPVAVAQTDAALLRDLAEENKKSVEALVLYPAETRLAILEATKSPEILIKMQDMREKTSAAFRTLVEDLPRTTQAVLYDLNRYPGLTASLVQQKNDPTALRKTLEALPGEKREEAFGVVSRQMPTLVQINELNQTTQRAFGRLIAGLAGPAQRAFEQLLGLPEVIDLLNEDLRFTILVGETYRDNPAWVIQKTDSLNLTVARAQAEELQDWKTTLENDPSAKAELESAARDYAAENGYADEDYASDDLYDREDRNYRNDDVVVHHYYQPYPYWYGYPWWEPYPRWRPYPWWWDWGFYPYPRGVVIVYLPSYHFTHWYFGNPRHHDHYNHLSAHFVNHYYGHRRSGTSITVGVREWRERNRTIISDDFMTDKTRLPERMKEYGRFEQGRQEFNTKNPRKTVSQEEFLDKNARKYPELRRSREVATTEIQRENELKREKTDGWAPRKAPAGREPAPVPKTERPPRIEPSPTQRPPKTDKPSSREPTQTQPAPKTERPATREPTPAQRPRTQPDAAKDYHRQQWEEKKPAQETRRSNPAPAPKTEKPRTDNRGRGGE